ncbi:unnamed protein product [Gongylonema pulchrum]|uniref:SOSS complex subunit A homolog n=1 Tax=Gongylonema pulchrum TaxID=637853 RepID=A0A183EIP1_9BILA|nr:unnamed protein product [Gongylonema pulchrum]
MTKLENGFALVQSRISGLSEKESYDVLLQMAGETKVFETITGGLVYGLLTEPSNAHKYFSIMSLLARDSWFCALCNMNMILFELYPRLKSEVREQIVYFFRNDLKETCSLLNAVAVMLNDNHAWLNELKPKASLIPVTLLTFTRFICDLSPYNTFEQLRSQMILVCQWLLTERFLDCAQLGRDLVLSLMRVSKIPAFVAIWKQLLYTPNKLGLAVGG